MTFNQEKALVGAFSVITNLRMELFDALVSGVSVIPRFIKRGHNNNCDVMYRQGDVSCVLPNVMGCKCWRGRPAACSIAGEAGRGI